jgi:LDH2 family malate/lactate/ureidoglycolate dehydrogenase
MTSIDAARVEAAARRLLEADGVPADQAADVARSLVDASLRGVDTHGVRLLPTYVAELRGGRAKRRPVFAIAGRLPAVAVLDGDAALGIVAGAAAMRLAIARAEQLGVAAVAVRNSNHFGRADYFAQLASARGQIGIVMSNSDALVVPVGGLAPLNGTNPIAMAAPGIDGNDFLLDMATSQTAYSRVLHAVRGGQPIAPGLAVTRSGRDAAGGGEVAALQPLGGIKGQGLGTMIQILCALLADMPFDAELSHLYAEPYDRPRQVSHFMIALEIGAFVDPARFRARLSQLLNTFRATPPADDAPIAVAGDPERASLRRRATEGIPIEEPVHRLLAGYL